MRVSFRTFLASITMLASILISGGVVWSQQIYVPPPQTAFPLKWRNAVEKRPWTMPLYDGPLPNSTGAPDAESEGLLFGWPVAEKVSKPTITAYLPAPEKSLGASVIIFPGGGYLGEFITFEVTTIAELLQNRGVAAFVVKYRLPSDVTMVDRSIGPLQDAQQAVRLVREHATDWNLDSGKVGVMGFSAGGHLAASVGTHFSKAYCPNPNSVNLRPDFMVLVYPVITMLDAQSNKGSRDALLGPNPPDTLAKLFSNELQVTDNTPSTLLLHAADDTIVDVDDSVKFFEAMRHHKAPVELIVFPKGDHGFFLMTRDEWVQPIFTWMTRNSWMKP